MPLETGDYISDLVETNPPGTDNVSQGDDHLRLIKHVLKTTFPNINGPVTSTDEELSDLGGGMPTVTTYSSPVTAQTHTFGVGKQWYRVYVTGGGGGGTTGSASAWAGTGGGTAIKVAAITSSSATYTVGAGGSTNNNGGSSSFSDGTQTVTGTGGNSGANQRGGSASGGDINIRGGGPENAENTNQTKGGGSYWSDGSPYNLSTASNSYGTGGRGSLVAGNNGGANGVIVIEEY